MWSQYFTDCISLISQISSLLKNDTIAREYPCRLWLQRIFQNCVIKETLKAKMYTEK